MINLLTSSGVIALADLFPNDVLFFILPSILVLSLFSTMAAACQFILFFYYWFISSSQYIPDPEWEDRRAIRGDVKAL